MLQCPMWQDFSYAYRLRSMNHVSHLPADPFLVAVYLQVVLLGASRSYAYRLTFHPSCSSCVFLLCFLYCWITCLTFQPIHSWWPCIYNLCCWMLALYRLLRTALPKEMVQNVSISVHKLSCIDHIFMTLLAVFFALFSLLLQMFCSVQCGKNVPTPTGSAVWIRCLTFQPIHSWCPCIYKLCYWMLALYRLLRTALPKEMVQNNSISVHQLSCIDHIFMTLLAVFFCFVFFIVADVFQCPMWQECSYAYRLRSMNHVSYLPADPFLVAVYLQFVLLGASPLQTATNSIA